MEKGTPIDLKDIKPGDMVRAEREYLGAAMTMTGKALRTHNDEFVVFDNGNGEVGLTAWEDCTYYLLSRPEKVIDKEDLKLGQRVRIEMKPCGTTDDCRTVIAEGIVVTLWGDRSGKLKGGQVESGNFYHDCITKVVLLS